VIWLTEDPEVAGDTPVKRPVRSVVERSKAAFLCTSFVTKAMSERMLPVLFASTVDTAGSRSMCNMSQPPVDSSSRRLPFSAESGMPPDQQFHRLAVCSYGPIFALP